MRSRKRWAFAFAMAILMQAWPALAQTSIPLNYNADNTRLVINVGINGGPGKPYLFDTGSTLFNSAYNPAWWPGFANAPMSNGAPSTPGLPTGIFYTYLGQSQPSYVGNIVQVPILSFYQASNLTTAVSQIASNPGFQVNTLYQGPNGTSFPSYFNNGNTTPPVQGQFYGTFGAGNFTTVPSGGYRAGGVLGQAVMPNVAAQGYVVSGNGQANLANVAGGPVVNSPSSGNSIVTVGGQQVQLCSPCVTLGLTPAVLGQFMPVGPPAANPGLVGAMQVASGNAFPVSGNPGSQQDSITIRATLNGRTVTTSNLLDTGTVDLGINQNLIGGSAGNTLTVVGVDAQGNPIVALPTTSMTLTTGLSGYSTVYTRNTTTTYVKMTLGIGFFMQNSVLYDLSDGLLSWTPYFVTAQPIATTAGGPLVIGGSNVMLGLAGTISGPGGVTINSGGNAQLSAVNTYTGPTLVNSGGTLLISGPGSIAQSSGVTNNGVFDISRAWAPVAVQSLAGSGTTYLGAQNLTITNGSGIYTGNIADSGGAYNTTGGSLTMAGGALTLGGANSYTGGTSVAGGSLTLTGSMVGPLSVSSGGTFALAAGGSYSNPGGTVLNLGSTVVNGTLTSNFLNGGVLSGAGTIAGNVANSGVVAPGNSIGTLSVSGNFTNAAGGTYLTEVAGSGLSDRLNIGGTATLKGGQVVVTALPGMTFAPSTTYTILSAAGGLSGTFASVNELYPFLQSSLSYDPNNVYLTLQIGGFAAAAVNPTQAAVGTVLDANVGNATGDFATVLGALAFNTVSDAQAQAALQQLSGNNYAGFSSAMVQGALLFMNNFAGLAGGGAPGGSRVALAEACDVACDTLSPPRWGAWGGGLGGLGTIGANQPVGGVTYNAGGFAAGLDRALSDSLRLGVTAGYTTGTQWVSGFAGQGRTDTFNVGLYGNYAQGPAYADALLGYAYSWNQMWRPIAIPGLQPRTALGQTGANQWYGQLEAGWRFDLGTTANAFVTPFARLQAYTGTQNAFTETGAQSLNLTIAQQTTNSLRSVLGAIVGGSMDLGWREKLALQLRLGWSHEYADVNRPVAATLAGAPALPFTTYGISPTRDGVLLGLGANTAIAEATSIYLRYEGTIAGQDSTQAITAGFRMTW